MNNPYASPTELKSQTENLTVALPEDIPAEHTFFLKGRFDGYEGDWHLALTDDAAYLYANPSKCYMIPRDKAWGKIGKLGPLITFEVNGESGSFEERTGLNNPDKRIIKTWVGAPSFDDLQQKLNGHSFFVFLLAMLFFLEAIPVAADPDNGNPAKPFSYFNLIVGCLLICGVSFRQLSQPRRLLFLVDAVFDISWAIYFFLIINNGESRWWALVIAVNLMAAQTNLRNYFRFKILRGENYRYEPLERNATETKDNVPEAATGNQFRESFKKLSS